MSAEEMSRASHTMASAAQEMLRAAGYADEVARQQRQSMDEWLTRFEAAVDKLTAALAVKDTTGFDYDTRQSGDNPFR